MSTPPEVDAAAPIDIEALAERFALKALVEACLILEEGVSTVREIDLGMMAGAGLIPPPFARADELGIDVVLAALERLHAEHGDRYAPPQILHRLVAQGRLGRSCGQGFFPYPQPDADFQQGEAVKLETRQLPDGRRLAIAWLDHPPANSLAPVTIAELTRIWSHVTATPAIRVMVIASANPQLFCAGADIKKFATLDGDSVRELVDAAQDLLRSFERSSVVTIAAVNGVALGGGCELAMGCDLRLAAVSASFAQPEINLGIIPGFGGTQRLRHLVGPGRALEMSLTGDPVGADEAYELGLVTRVAADHELFDAALAWARRLAAQPPLAVEQIKLLTAAGDLDERLDAEKQAFAGVFASDDAREGVTAFIGRRPARFAGS